VIRYDPDMRDGMPDVFVEFCQWFHQDVFMLYPSWDQAISAFVAQLDDTSKMTLNVYLGDLIASDATERHGETVTPPRNRKSGNGNPSPTAERATILPDHHTSRWRNGRVVARRLCTNAAENCAGWLCCHRRSRPGLGAFRQGLGELGYVEGQTWKSAGPRGA